ncbi:MAG: aspartate aminotransferase family protein [Anaerolineae bacterium]
MNQYEGGDMTDGEQIKAWNDQYVLHTYARAPFVLERGEGAYVYDTEGKRYLDFVSGIAVNALGYGDPEVTRAITEQLGRLVHVSNLYYTIPQAQLAKMLVEASFADKVFFCNSGTEAAEAALKFARKWARLHFGEGKTEVLAFEGAFHGRTMGALSVTPRASYQDPFRPLVPGAKFGAFNDLASADALLDAHTCACIVEPVQGEGGVNAADPAFLGGLRRLCDERGILLIFDEVQCGLGRCGTLWAHELSGVTPDLMTLAKPLGGGLPIGATLMTQNVADAMQPGDHGSTFAANPVVCAAAQAVFARVSQPEFLAGVRAEGQHLGDCLRAMQAKYPAIREVRGLGMIWGVAMDRDVSEIVLGCYDEGLLTCKAGAQVLRLLPPLTTGNAEIEKAAAILDRVFARTIQG